ncbi:MAG: hypothetical protein NC043_07010 [Muribaculaceae bacterium]|nr:hypothetical protein [Muribaculaceae bacterium]
MANVRLTFTIPGNELPALHGMMEADGTPPCELRICKTTVPRVIRDIVTDGDRRAGVRDIVITTDEVYAGYFRDNIWALGYRFSNKALAKSLRDTPAASAARCSFSAASAVNENDTRTLRGLAEGLRPAPLRDPPL